jgi:hypothetical protein
MLRSVSVLLLASACAPQYDQALLDQYKASIPDEDTLQARAATSGVLALGDQALFPTLSAPVTVGINGAIATVVGGLRFVTTLEPSGYDAETQQFVWGPWNDDRFGKAAVWIQKNPEGSEFAYSYALLRGTTRRLEGYSPIIVGGATPDPDRPGRGVGVTLWDADANLQFLEENGQPTAGLDGGKFVALYGRGPVEEDTELRWVVSSFRDFTSADDPAGASVDLDYFHGHAWDGAQEVDFLDYQASVDVDDPRDGVVENLDVRMAFLDRGIGRGEAGAYGGSLEAGDRVEVTECWNDAVRETYLAAERVDGDGATEELYQLGSPAGCAAPFDRTLDELEIPSLADVDPSLLADLDAIAEGGVDSVEWR